MKFILDNTNNLVKNIEMLLSYPNYYFGDIVICCEEKSFHSVKDLNMVIYSDDHPPMHFHLISKNGEKHYKVYLDKDMLITHWEKQQRSSVIRKNAQKTITDWFNRDGYIIFNEEWGNVMGAYNAR